MDEGYDVVSGWRKDRQDTLSRRLPSQLANGLISAVTGVHLHDYGCTLKAYRREVITGFRLYGEMHRFIPVYANSVGARILEVPVHHHARRFGKAKYGLERTAQGGARPVHGQVPEQLRQQADLPVRRGGVCA